MTIIVTLDDNGGMLFGGRRQSRDRVLCERVKALATDKRLFVSTYSASLFEGFPVITGDDYADTATAGDLVFVENGDLPFEKASTVIVYRWNRRYPADRVFPTAVLETDFTLQSTAEFVGSSHDTITEDVYIRR